MVAKYGVIQKELNIRHKKTLGYVLKNIGLRGNYTKKIIG